MRDGSSAQQLDANPCVINMPPDADPGECRIELPAQSPRDVIESALHARPFAADTPSPSPLELAEMNRQRALETRYLDWAAGVMEMREKAFGSSVPYEPANDMAAPWQDALLCAAYDSARQFLSSAARSPVTNTFVAATGPRVDADGQQAGEFTFRVDAAVVGGAVGGVTSYVTDTYLLQAMDRCAKRANFPQLVAIDPKVIFPDPGPVALRIVDGAKQYWEPGNAGDGPESPSLSALKAQAEERRERLSRWQKRIEGNGLVGAWLHPSLTGALNVARRAVSSADVLMNPLLLGPTSMLASASAGGLSKLGLGMAKGTPVLAQQAADDLAGGTQKLNLFVLKQPDPGTPAAGWKDVRGLPSLALKTGREAWDLVAQTFSLQRSWAQRGDQAWDVLRTALASSTASFLASGAGPFMATILRDGSHEAAAGESPQSAANLLQQFTQSVINDIAWKSIKTTMDGESVSVAAELDRSRRVSQDQLEVAPRPRLAGGSAAQA